MISKKESLAESNKNLSKDDKNKDNDKNPKEIRLPNGIDQGFVFYED